MKSYPIWNRVTACIYKTSRDWGAKREAAVSVLVGSSAANSHAFVDHCATHREHENGDREFRFYVDRECVKRAVLRKGERRLQFLGPLEDLQPTRQEQHAARVAHLAREMARDAIRLPNGANGNPRYYFARGDFRDGAGQKFRPDCGDVRAYTGKRYGAGWAIGSYGLEQDLRDALMRGGSDAPAF